MYTVDKGVPLPKSASQAKYPWSEMAVGDSFFVPSMTESARGGLTSIAKSRGIKISTRKMDGGIRVWRVA